MHFFPETENDHLCHIHIQTTTENKKNNQEIPRLGVILNYKRFRLK